ncbi:MAG: hypothetical protein PWQ18_731 [Clostridia bacterium]|nr:hypothetical protein [Clostridia bacterium]
MYYYLIPILIAIFLAPIGPAGTMGRAEAASPGTSSVPTLGEGLFPDAAGHWAAEPLNFMGALGIVSGYPDGTCRPDQPLTAVEAVALLLRSTEYSTAGGPGTARRTPLPTRPPLNRRTPTPGADNQSPPDKIPSAAAWAAGDLNLALEQGILTEDELQEDILLQPAPRHLVWQLLARALKIPLDEGANLNFQDAALVPAAARPAAATLARLGLLQGFPDGTLRPAATITRAELLALLARMVADGWLNPAPARRLEGWVQEVKQAQAASGTRRPPARPLPGRPAGAEAAPGSGTAARPGFPSRPGAAAAPSYLVTLSTPVSGSKDYPLAADAVIFDAPLPGPQGIFNRHVTAVLNQQNELAFVKAMEPRQFPGQLSIYYGTLEKVIQGRDLQVIIRDLSHDLHTQATSWATTAPKGLLSLPAGQWVKVTLTGDTIWSLEPLEVKRVAGTVESIEGRKIYLDNFDQNLGNVFLDWERARLSNQDGTPYSGSGLKAGSKVEITCLDWDKLLEIRASQ